MDEAADPALADELRRRRGRKSKGIRSPIAVRPTPDLKALYEERAAEMGIPLSSWVLLHLNRQLDLPVPPFVIADLEHAAETRENIAARDELEGMEELLRRAS